MDHFQFQPSRFYFGVLLTCPQNLEKTIPDTPKGEVPVHLREKQLFADDGFLGSP